MFYAGEIAALLTATCWSANSVLFTLAGRRVGSGTVNTVRIWLALLFIMILHTILFGIPFPWNAEPQRFFWLGLSGLIGFALGDAMLFEAFILIGPRLAMLLMTLVPIYSTILGLVFLGEALSLPEIAAILVTVGGIAWVVGERSPVAGSPRRISGLGLLLGCGGALGQATGLLLSKVGLAGGFSPVSANTIRVAAGALALATFALIGRRLGGHVRKLKDSLALAEITGGALSGPVIGVIFSLYAIAHTQLGIASTLMSLSPVLLLPISHFVFRERITPRAVAGTLLALGGASALFFI